MTRPSPIYRARTASLNGRYRAQLTLAPGQELRFEGMTWKAIGKHTSGTWVFQARGLRRGTAEVRVHPRDLRFADARDYRTLVEREAAGRKTNYPMLHPDLRVHIDHWLDGAVRVALLEHERSHGPFVYLPGRLLPHPDIGSALAGDSFHGRLDR